MNKSELNTAMVTTVPTLAATSAGGNTNALMITLQVSGCLILLADSWILLNMILYGLKTWSKSSKQNEIDGRAVFIACTAAIALAIPRLLTTQISFIIPLVSITALKHCEIIMDICHFSYTIAAFSIYIFLWVRQRAIYQHSAIEKLTGKRVVVCSWVSLIMLTMMIIATACLFIVPSEYAYTAYGCVLKWTLSNSTQIGSNDSDGSYYALAGVHGILQIVLLTLLVYPMILIISSQSYMEEKSRLQAIWEVCSRIFSGRETSTRLEKTVRRSILCTLVAMVSDLIVLILAAGVFPATWPRSIVMAFYDVSSFINVLCILVTFEKFRNIVTGACRKFLTVVDLDEAISDDNSAVAKKGNK